MAAHSLPPLIRPGPCRSSPFVSDWTFSSLHHQPSPSLLDPGEIMENSSSRDESFPAGLRVLVVDDDPTWLKILEKMLRKCSYEGGYALSSMFQVASAW